jgi:hypothetical protein
MAVRRASFEFVGGFDESNLAPSFRDVDLCIRLRRAGYRVMWTPHARLLHQRIKRRVRPTGDAQEEQEKEIAHMREHWGDLFARDPFWNLNLSLRSSIPQINMPPRVARPWSGTHARQS